MKRMIDDLSIFTPTRQGDVLPIDLTSQDMGRIGNDVADEVRASYPDAKIELRLMGEPAGESDGARLGQLLVNLFVNAVQHGTSEMGGMPSATVGQITLVVLTEARRPARDLPTLFDPLTRAGPVKPMPGATPRGAVRWNLRLANPLTA